MTRFSGGVPIARAKDKVAGSYWHRTLNQKLSRRRALAAYFSAGGAAAILTACGSGNSKSSSIATPGASSGLLTESTDTSQQAKRGGVMQLNRSADPVNWDPHFTQAGWNV